MLKSLGRGEEHGITGDVALSISTQASLLPIVTDTESGAEALGTNVGVCTASGELLAVVRSGQTVPAEGFCVLTTTSAKQKRLLLDIRVGQHLHTPSACTRVAGGCRLLRIEGGEFRGVAQLLCRIRVGEGGRDVKIDVDPLPKIIEDMEAGHEFVLSARNGASVTRGSSIEATASADRFLKFLPGRWRYNNVFVDSKVSHPGFVFDIPGRGPQYLKVDQDISSISLRQRDEVAPPATASRVWPSAYVLSRVIEDVCHQHSLGSYSENTEVIRKIMQLRDRLQHARTDKTKHFTAIELGCGLALPSLVLASYLSVEPSNSDLLATDLPDNLELVTKQIVANERSFLRQSIGGSDANSVKQSVLRSASLDWTKPPDGPVQSVLASTRGAGFDLVLSADCVFWPWLFQPLISTLLTLCGRDTIVLLSLKDRLAERTKSFVKMLTEQFEVLSLCDKEGEGLANQLGVVVLMCQLKRGRSTSGSASLPESCKQQPCVIDVKPSGQNSTSRQRKMYASRRFEAVRALPPIRLVLDLGFAATLNAREQRSLAMQSVLLYSAVRKCRVPAQLTLSSFGERGDAQCDTFYKTLLKDNPASWDQTFVTLEASSIADIAAAQSTTGESSNFVYMSPDAKDVLRRVNADTTYVFGGIVDRTHAKHLTSEKASALGMRSARLPLREYANFPKNRPCVLNIDAAAKILLGAHAIMQRRRLEDIAAGKAANSNASEEEWASVWKTVIESVLPRKLFVVASAINAHSTLPSSEKELLSLSKSQLGSHQRLCMASFFCQLFTVVLCNRTTQHQESTVQAARPEFNFLQKYSQHAKL